MLKEGRYFCDKSKNNIKSKKTIKKQITKNLSSGVKLYKNGFPGAMHGSGLPGSCFVCVCVGGDKCNQVILVNIVFQTPCTIVF